MYIDMHVIITAKEFEKVAEKMDALIDDDISIMKTMLVITKGLRDRSEIKESYNALTKRLEAKLGTRLY